MTDAEHKFTLSSNLHPAVFERVADAHAVVRSPSVGNLSPHWASALYTNIGNAGERLQELDSVAGHEDGRRNGPLAFDGNGGAHDPSPKHEVARSFGTGVCLSREKKMSVAIRCTRLAVKESPQQTYNVRSSWAPAALFAARGRYENRKRALRESTRHLRKIRLDLRPARRGRDRRRGGGEPRTASAKCNALAASRRCMRMVRVGRRLLGRAGLLRAAARPTLGALRARAGAVSGSDHRLASSARLGSRGRLV